MPVSCGLPIFTCSKVCFWFTPNRVSSDRRLLVPENALPGPSRIPGRQRCRTLGLTSNARAQHKAWPPSLSAIKPDGKKRAQIVPLTSRMAFQASGTTLWPAGG